jgi:pilus assembly protein TadC
MEEKKTTKTSKSKKSDIGSGLMEFFWENVFQSVQSFFDGAVENVQQMLQRFMRRLARRTFLFFFAFLGIIFLLVGLSQLLSAMYRFPGSGQAIIGLFILLICLVIYMFDRNDN